MPEGTPRGERPLSPTEVKFQGEIVDLEKFKPNDYVAVNVDGEWRQAVIDKAPKVEAKKFKIDVHLGSGSAPLTELELDYIPQIIDYPMMSAGVPAPQFVDRKVNDPTQETTYEVTGMTVRTDTGEVQYDLQEVGGAAGTEVKGVSQDWLRAWQKTNKLEEDLATLSGEIVRHSGEKTLEWRKRHADVQKEIASIRAKILPDVADMPNKDASTAVDLPNFDASNVEHFDSLLEILDLKAEDLVKEMEDITAELAADSGTSSTGDRLAAGAEFRETAEEKVDREKGEGKDQKAYKKFAKELLAFLQGEVNEKRKSVDKTRDDTLAEEDEKIEDAKDEIKRLREPVEILIARSTDGRLRPDARRDLQVNQIPAEEARIKPEIDDQNDIIKQAKKDKKEARKVHGDSMTDLEDDIYEEFIRETLKDQGEIDRFKTGGEDKYEKLRDEMNTARLKAAAVERKKTILNTLTGDYAEIAIGAAAYDPQMMKNIELVKSILGDWKDKKAPEAPAEVEGAVDFSVESKAVTDEIGRLYGLVSEDDKSKGPDYDRLFDLLSAVKKEATYRLGALVSAENIVKQKYLDHLADPDRYGLEGPDDGTGTGNKIDDTRVNADGISDLDDLNNERIRVINELWSTLNFVKGHVQGIKESEVEEEVKKSRDTLQQEKIQEKADKEQEIGLVDLPPSVINEILENSGKMANVRDVMRNLLEGAITRSSDGTVADVIDPAAVDAMKSIFEGTAAPTIDLRKFGVKDWSHFLNLWKNHLAEKMVAPMAYSAEQTMQKKMAERSDEFTSKLQQLWGIKGQIAARVVMTGGAVFGLAAGGAALLGMAGAGGAVAGSIIGGAGGGALRGGLFKRLFGGEHFTKKRQQKFEEWQQATRGKLVDEVLVEQFGGGTRKSFWKGGRSDAKAAEQRRISEGMNQFTAVMSQTLREVTGQLQKFKTEKTGDAELKHMFSVMTVNEKLIFERSLDQLETQNPEGQKKKELAILILRMRSASNERMVEKIKQEVDPQVISVFEAGIKAHSGERGVAAAAFSGAALATVFNGARGLGQMEVAGMAISGMDIVRGGLGAVYGMVGGYKFAEGSRQRRERGRARNELLIRMERVMEANTQLINNPSTPVAREQLRDDVVAMRRILSGNASQYEMGAMIHVGQETVIEMVRGKEKKVKKPVINPDTNLFIQLQSVVYEAERVGMNLERPEQKAQMDTVLQGMIETGNRIQEETQEKTSKKVLRFFDKWGSRVGGVIGGAVVGAVASIGIGSRMEDLFHGDSRSGSMDTSEYVNALNEKVRVAMGGVPTATAMEVPTFDTPPVDLTAGEPTPSELGAGKAIDPRVTRVLDISSGYRTEMDTGASSIESTLDSGARGGGGGAAAELKIDDSPGPGSVIGGGGAELKIDDAPGPGSVIGGGDVEVASPTPETISTETVQSGDNMTRIINRFGAAHDNFGMTDAEFKTWRTGELDRLGYLDEHGGYLPHDQYPMHLVPGDEAVLYTDVDGLHHVDIVGKSIDIVPPTAAEEAATASVADRVGTPVGTGTTIPTGGGTGIRGAAAEVKIGDVPGPGSVLDGGAKIGDVPGPGSVLDGGAAAEVKIGDVPGPGSVLDGSDVELASPEPALPEVVILDDAGRETMRTAFGAVQEQLNRMMENVSFSGRGDYFSQLLLSHFNADKVDAIGELELAELEHASKNPGDFAGAYIEAMQQGFPAPDAVLGPEEKLLLFNLGTEVEVGGELGSVIVSPGSGSQAIKFDYNGTPVYHVEAGKRFSVAESGQLMVHDTATNRVYYVVPEVTTEGGKLNVEFQDVMDVAQEGMAEAA